MDFEPLRLFWTTGVVLISTLSPAFAQDDARIAYRLVSTAVVVTGTVTSKNDFATEKRLYVPADALMQLVSETDAKLFVFDPPSALLSKDTLTVQVGSNGSLRSINVGSEGQLGAIA